MGKSSNIKSLIVDEKSSLKKIISVINSNGYGTCFVTSKSKFKAVITDGDIRKLILKNYKLNKNIYNFISKKRSVTASYLSSNLDILKKLSDNIKIIPILDSKKNIIDFSTIDKVKKINIYETHLKGNEFNYVMNCLRTNWISSTGKYVSLFEKKFSKLFKIKYSLSLSSGTSGLHLAMKTLNIGYGDEVILPNMTFAATVNSVINSGAKPVFVDIDKKTYNLNPSKISEKITKKTKAIICVHLYGQPCEMKLISKIAKKNKLFLVEDCAEALGSKYNGKYISYFGDISVFSFFGNKTITTGEGGMLVTQKKSFFAKAKSLRDHGMDEKKKYWHNEVGFNYRMTNMQAAIGLAQLENVNDIIKRKIWIAFKYEQEINKLKKRVREKIIL
ncbi:aminotransferase class I/II-fold pyridoxal phosphate-dependent enzyme, partial [Candidatus Pelagibacter sp.]|nr:aminotransferase class I/II-fold pyridoxal phosphate-dependent enzyme [Candidatus Pelagibacter sp.]